MIVWSDTLLIGIDEIDDQHRGFFDLLNRLDAHSEAGVSRQDLREILAELVSYAEHHFIEEERYMRATGYPLLGDHTAMHDAAAAKIHDVLIRDVDEAEIYRFLSGFLRSWLMTHIMCADAAFGVWLQQTSANLLNEAMAG